MMFDVGFVKLAAFTMIGMALPVRPALAIHFQSQMFTGGFHSEVLNVCTGESAATHEAVAGSARPTNFDCDRPYSAGQRQQPADHRGGTYFEPVTIRG